MNHEAQNQSGFASSVEKVNSTCFDIASLDSRQCGSSQPPGFHPQWTTLLERPIGFGRPTDLLRSLGPSADRDSQSGESRCSHAISLRRSRLLSSRYLLVRFQQSPGIEVFQTDQLFRLLVGDPDIDDQVTSALLSFLTQDRSATAGSPLELDLDVVMRDAGADERQDSPSGFSFDSSR
jgi:hypothetical protein